MIDQRVKTLLKVFVFYLIALSFITIAYDNLPILLDYSLFGEESFYSGFITNMYNSALDFLVFSIILFIILGKHKKNDKVLLYTDNIDDCRFLYTEEAAFKNAANVRRLQELGIREFDLSKSTLQNTKLKRLKFKQTRFMGACLEGSNFDQSTFEDSNFQGVKANGASLNNTKFVDCNFKYFEFHNGQMAACNEIVNCDFTKSRLAKTTFRASIFKNCSFKGADLTDCSFERADLRDAKDLTASQLMKCKNIMYAKVNTLLKNEINEINPKVLKK